MSIITSSIRNSNGTTYTITTDSPSDWASVANSTYFKNLSDGVIYYKTPTSNIVNVISSSYAISTSIAISASYAPAPETASFSLTASYVNTLNQNVLITGSVTIGSSSLGASENTLTLGSRDTTSEGGQLGLNAPGGTWTSASMIDNYQNQIRILRGTNASSTGLVASWNLHTLQMLLPAYTAASSFPGTAAANLAVDSSGNVITVSTSGGTVFPYTGNAVITGSLTTTGIIYAQPNGGMYFQGGDDAALYDINVSNHMGIYGVQDSTVGAIKLGSSGPVLYGSGSKLGIGTTNPSSASLTINGNVWATSFTGSLFGTSSWAENVISSSYALTASYALNSSGGTIFPYTGSALITGSLGVTGSLSVFNPSNNTVVLNTSTYTLKGINNSSSIDWSGRELYNESGTRVLSWKTLRAYDNFSSGSIDWSTRVLADQSGSKSLDWGTRVAIDSNTSSSLSWALRQSYDSGQKISIDWDIRRSYDTTAVLSTDWSARGLYDANAKRSILWKDRTAYDGSESGSIAWGKRQLFDNYGLLAADWSFGARTLNDGYTSASINWDSRAAYDINVSRSVFWDARDLYDANSTSVANWGSQTLTDNTSVLSVDWTNRSLYDASGNQSIDWYSRALVDANGNIVMYFDPPSNGNKSLQFGYYDLTVSNNEDLIDWAYNNGYLNAAGENITYGTNADPAVLKGELCSLGEDGIWYTNDQSSISSSAMLGICIEPWNKSIILTEGTITVVTASGYTDIPFVEGTVFHGRPVYLTGSLGGLTTTKPTSGYVRVVGHMYYNSTTYTDYWLMKFRPSNDWYEI